ncbi:MAG: rhodanese-like domain-containing protein [Acidobacteriota bacterium]
MTKTITRAALRNKLESERKPLLIEALPAKYFQQAHLPGAINIPHDAIDALAPKLLPDKDVEIVVYCASTSCKNSDIAAQRLAALGYSNVAVYSGGKADWQINGLSLESGAHSNA